MRPPHDPDAKRCRCKRCRYIRHAERFGTDEVFEAAVRDRLRVEDLGVLSLRLQNIDPKWTLPQSVRRALALALAARKVDARTICRMAMISRWTLNRLVQVPKFALEPAFQSGALGAIRPSEGNGSRDPVLSLDTAA